MDAEQRSYTSYTKTELPGTLESVTFLLTTIIMSRVNSTWAESLLHTPTHVLSLTHTQSHVGNTQSSIIYIIYTHLFPGDKQTASGIWLYHVNITVLSTFDEWASGRGCLQISNLCPTSRTPSGSRKNNWATFSGIVYFRFFNFHFALCNNGQKYTYLVNIARSFHNKFI